MLRGVNVGGHNPINMGELRALYESLGLKEPQTYVQSGNVVFRSSDGDLDALSEKISRAIEKKFDVKSAVILRTCAELKKVISNNPFAKRTGIEPSKLLVAFLESDPSAEIRKALLAIPCEPEEVRCQGRELYIYYPNGIGRPKLTWTMIDKTVKQPVTGRNWNTVQKLFEMAKKLEG